MIIAPTVVSSRIRWNNSCSMIPCPNPCRYISNNLVAVHDIHLSSFELQRHKFRLGDAPSCGGTCVCLSWSCALQRAPLRRMPGRTPIALCCSICVVLWGPFRSCSRCQPSIGERGCFTNLVSKRTLCADSWLVP